MRLELTRNPNEEACNPHQIRFGTSCLILLLTTNDCPGNPGRWHDRKGDVGTVKGTMRSRNKERPTRTLCILDLRTSRKWVWRWAKIGPVRKFQDDDQYPHKHHRKWCYSGLRPDAYGWIDPNSVVTIQVLFNNTWALMGQLITERLTHSIILHSRLFVEWIELFTE